MSAYFDLLKGLDRLIKEWSEEAETLHTASQQHGFSTRGVRLQTECTLLLHKIRQLDALRKGIQDAVDNQTDGVLRSSSRT